MSETRSAATGVAGAVEGPLTGLEAYTWGQHAGSAFAQGLASQAAATEAAAQQLAAATHAAIGFSPPTTVGPLATIRSWGPHLVADLARRASSATSATSSGPRPGSRVP